MDKTFLEEKIKERAEDRLRKDLKQLAEAVNSNPVGRRLNIYFEKEEDNESGEKKSGRGLCVGGPAQSAIIGSEGIGKEAKALGLTNIEEVEEELLKQYEKEETGNLLKSMESLQYMFSKHNDDLPY